VKRKILKKHKNKLQDEFDLYCGLEHICNILKINNQYHKLDINLHEIAETLRGKFT
jgi:hypothetical protein